MIHNKTDALLSLKPNAQWEWRGTEYSGLEWLDTGTAPTESEIDAEVTRLNNAEPMTQLRYERNKKIAESDWRANSDVTLSEDWKTYRQQLRDITKTYKSLSDVKWPSEPSE